ncbi:MAG: hypothetical protein KAH03_04170 [Cocleimonas sp.]|nr:hypothetical protein [Cocleimonas sp.]
MSKFLIITLSSLFLSITLQACTDKETPAEKKVERPVAYDQFGNKVIYTADGEKELINDDCE